MALRESNLEKLGPFPAGANNVALETSVPQKSFREGINVDVRDDGKIERRDGYELRIAADEPHSLFAYGYRAFFVEGVTLMSFELINGAETLPILLYDDLVRDAPLAHCLVDPDIYVSDGDVALRIAPNGVVAPWSLPIPTAPLVSAAAGGSLFNGTYGVAYAYKASTGEEGALSDTAFVEAATGSTLTLQIPTTPYRVAVYMTKPDGQELLLYGVVPGSVGSVAINKQALSRPPVTEDCDPMPAGQHAAVWNGRLLVSSGPLLIWSVAFQYGVTRLNSNYRELLEDITMLAAVDTAQGFFLGQQSRTYYVAGADPDDARLIEAYPAGVVPGTMRMVPGARLPFENPPKSLVPMWLATNGVFCVGLPDGTIEPLTESRFAARVGDRGTAAFVQKDGLNRFLATVRNPADNNFAMSDQFTAEVVRNNITIP